MKKLKIAQIAPLWYPVPPPKYGGIERVVFNLTEELVKRGHKVTLFATGDSKTSAELVSVLPKALSKRCATRKDAVTYKGLNPLSALVAFKKEKEFDIIHDHLETKALLMSQFVDTPVIHTLHSPLYASHRVLYSHFPSPILVSLSLAQRKQAPDLPYAANIPNGIDVEKYSLGRKKEDYLLFLGRIAPYKGILEAIEIAKLAKKRLVIAALIEKWEEPFFRKRVEPEIDGKQIVFLGEVGERKKIRLLKKAQVLLFPIRWQEPFGLVMIEAMACGTPIIAPKRASVPEIVVDKKTGFVVSRRNMVQESAQAIKELNDIDPRACRDHVKENFSIEKMVDQYEELYSRVIHTERT